MDARVPLLGLYPDPRVLTQELQTKLLEAFDSLPTAVQRRVMVKVREARATGSMLELLLVLRWMLNLAVRLSQDSGRQR